METPVPVSILKFSNLGHGYWLVLYILGWVTIQGLDVDAVKYCKIPEAEKRGLNYMLLRKKKEKKYIYTCKMLSLMQILTSLIGRAFFKAYSIFNEKT